MKRLSFTNILGCLMTLSTVLGNSKVIYAGFPTPSERIFTSARKLKKPHSSLSLLKILYSILVCDNLFRASFSSELSLSHKPARRLMRPISQVKILCSGSLFRQSLAIRIRAFIDFLSTRVVTLLIWTMLLCFLISQEVFLSSKRETWPFLVMVLGKW